MLKNEKGTMYPQLVKNDCQFCERTKPENDEFKKNKNEFYLVKHLNTNKINLLSVYFNNIFNLYYF